MGGIGIRAWSRTSANGVGFESLIRTIPESKALILKVLDLFCGTIVIIIGKHLFKNIIYFIKFFNGANLLKQKYIH